MRVTFEEQGHTYKSIPARSWTSVTTLVESFANPFDAEKQAVMSSGSHKSKWFGIPPKKIIRIWDDENERSTRIGSLYHLKKERQAITTGKKVHRGKEILVFPSIFEGDMKIARDQVLEDGVYPEHIVYNEKIGAIGQIDLPMISNGYIDIDDYKTNKEIEMESYGTQVGNPRMMTGPVSHVMDCNYWHYALQFSLYMKLILLKNKTLKPGKLTLKHVDFKLKGRDKYGFPIIAMDDEGYPIVRKKTDYEMPYMEKEAIALLKTLIK